VFTPNSDSAVFRIRRAQFADAASIKAHDDPDRTKYTLDRLIPFPTSMQNTSGAISLHTPMSVPLLVLLTSLIVVLLLATSYIVSEYQTSDFFVSASMIGEKHLWCNEKAADNKMSVCDFRWDNKMDKSIIQDCSYSRRVAVSLIQIANNIFESLVGQWKIITIQSQFVAGFDQDSFQIIMEHLTFFLV
jgi:hypothetical protein